MSSILIGVLSALAGSIVTALLQKWPSRAWHAFLRWYRPDHSSPYHGWPVSAAMSSREAVRIQILFAPDRSLDRSSLHPDAAIKLTHDLFTGEFPEDPAFSLPNHGVRFDRGGDGLNDGYTWVWAHGRLDYDCYLMPRFENGRAIISLLDILKPVAAMVRASSSVEYERVFGRSRWRRRRFDWFVAVSPGIVTSDGMNMSWTDLDFPGVRPRRVRPDPQAFCPSEGYAHQALMSWDSRRPTADLLKIFLEDFLQQNGYYDCNAAIEDALRAFTQAETIALLPAQD